MNRYWGFALLVLVIISVTACDQRDIIINNNSPSQCQDQDGDGICDYADICTTDPGNDWDNDGECAPMDCDDANPDVNHSAPESCDGIDNDCNGLADAVCNLELNSLPEYDGHYRWWHVLPEPAIDQIVVSKHGWNDGLVSLPGSQIGQRAFVTFDLSAYLMDWDRVSEVNFLIYLNLLYFGPPPAEWPAGPLVVEVRQWQVSDYSNLADCKSTWNFGEPEPVFDPLGCQLPEINYTDVLFGLVPLGEGWYGLASADDKAKLQQLLADNASQKISFWLDYKASLFFISDEMASYDPRLDAMIQAPPSLEIFYAE